MLRRNSFTKLLKAVGLETNRVVMAKLSLDSRFEIKPLTLNNKDEAVALLIKYYINDYIMQYIPGFNHSDAVEYLSTHFDYCIKQNYSVGIFEKSTSPLVAISLNYVKHKNPDGSSSAAHGCSSPAIRAHDKFMATLDGNLYDVLKSDRVFHAGMAAVHSEYRKHGLFSVIEKCCLHFGLKSECDYLVVRPTTEYLIKGVAAAKYYMVLNEMNYADYIDPDTGLKLFPNIKFPHVRVQLLCVKLKELSLKPMHIFSHL